MPGKKGPRMSTVNAVPSIAPEEVVRQLRALREQIPNFVLLSREEARSLDRAAAVDVALVHASINAIAASTPLQTALERDADTLRSESELTGRWSQVVDEMEAFRLGVAGSIKVRRHRLGATALKAYQVSVQLARYKENANLLPHIDAMKRAARFSKRRAAQSQPAPVPSPAPAQVKQQ